MRERWRALAADGHATDSQRGQAVLLTLAALLVASLLAAVVLTLWVRSAVRAQRFGETTAALYAAEAGVARTLAAMARGTLAPPRAEPITLAGTVGAAPGSAAYTVRVVPDGPARWRLVSTGVQGRSRHEVQVTVTAPYAMPVYAGTTLTFHVTPRAGALRFAAAPGYGGAPPRYRGPGTVSPTPVAVRLALPDIPFGVFAELAGSPPPWGAAPDAGAERLGAGWYEGGRCRGPHPVIVPRGVTAAVRGSLRCDPGLVLEAGATLVVTADLAVRGALILEPGARLVVGGDATLQTVELGPAGPGAAPVLVVIGGTLGVAGAIGATAGAATVPPLAVLALDRSDCSAPACGADHANVLDLGWVRVRDVLAYAEPLATGDAEASRITLALGAGPAGGGKGSGPGPDEPGRGPAVGTLRVRGAVVAAGSVTIRAHRVAVDWDVDLGLLTRYLGIAPGFVPYAVEAWQG